MIPISPSPPSLIISPRISLSPFQYNVPPNDVGSRTLWLSVWDWDRFSRDQFLGEVRLALSSLNLSGNAAHWYTLQDKVRAVTSELLELCLWV